MYCVHVMQEMYIYVCVCVHVCVRACVRACVRPCVRACVNLCPRKVKMYVCVNLCPGKLKCMCVDLVLSQVRHSYSAHVLRIAKPPEANKAHCLSSMWHTSIQVEIIIQLLYILTPRHSCCHPCACRTFMLHLEVNL